MTSRRKKRGKKPSYLTYFGKDYEGIYVQKRGDKESYYCLDELGKQIYLSVDPVVAIQKYQERKDKDAQDSFFEVPEEAQEIPIPFSHGVLHDPDYISRSFIIAKARELFEEDRVRFANEFGYPQLAHLEDVKPLPASFTLKEICESFNERTDIARRTVRDHVRYFKIFISIIKRSTIRDIAYNDIGLYGTSINTLSKRKRITNRYEWIRANFSGTKRVLRYYRDRTEYKEDFKRVYEYMEQLKNIRKTVIRPKILSQEQFWELYENSRQDAFARCIFLLGINCAFKYSEISHLTEEAIDLSKKTLSFPRPKTGIIQSSMLWDETVEALKQHMSDKPNDSEFVFLTKYKNQYQRDDLSDRFKRIKGKKSENVTQNILKPSFETTATDAGINSNAIDIVMGHSIKGLDNNYNQRNPRATTAAVEAVYNHYFKSTL